MGGSRCRSTAVPAWGRATMSSPLGAITTRNLLISTRRNTTEASLYHPPLLPSLRSTQLFQYRSVLIDPAFFSQVLLQLAMHFPQYFLVEFVGPATRSIASQSFHPQLLVREGDKAMLMRSVHCVAIRLSL